MNLVQQYHKQLFDRDIQKPPVFSMLIHTDSFANDILNQTAIAKKLFKLARFDYCEILSLPTSNMQVKEKLVKEKIPITEYEIQSRNENGNLRFGELLCYLPKEAIGSQDLFSYPVKGSALSLIDIFVSYTSSFDHFIVNEFDTIHLQNSGARTLDAAIDKLRLLLVNNEIFYVDELRTKPAWQLFFDEEPMYF
ncbi:MAG: hypothetical protein IVW51_03620 [Thermaceae bacterium]|nr:hypothetical protein [Thermaceae bacterium]